MKKVLNVVAAILIFSGLSSSLRAEEIKNNFQAHLDHKSIDALTQDLGAMIGGGTFHTGKSLGFPIGFDVGVHSTYVGIQGDDKILSDDGSTWGGIFGQAEVGLPFNINVIGRYGTLGDGDVIGGGLRYGILRPSVPGLPDLSISGLYDKMDHDFFDLTTYTANLALSFDFPIIRPYAGVGYDWSSMKLKDAAFGLAPVTDLDSDESGYRAEIGINLSIIPFTYITLAGGVANGQEMYHAGLGVTF